MVSWNTENMELDTESELIGCALQRDERTRIQNTPPDFDRTCRRRTATLE